MFASARRSMWSWVFQSTPSKWVGWERPQSFVAQFSPGRNAIGDPLW